MGEIICYGVDGRPLRKLYQWDVNQTIRISGITSNNIVSLHFCNRFSTAANVVMPSKITENEDSTYDIIGDIPNELLQQAEAVTVYLYATDGDSAYQTTYEIKLPVVERPKPDDYIDTPDEVKTWEDHEQRISALEAGRNLRVYMERHEGQISVKVDGLDKLVDTSGLELRFARYSRRHLKNYWEHPERFGYAEIAGRVFQDGMREEIAFPDVPDWMPRGGLLQTSYALEDYGDEITINPYRDFLDAAKPFVDDDGSVAWDSVRIYSAQGNHAPLVVRYDLFKDGELLVKCENELRIGVRRGEINAIPITGIGASLSLATGDTYISIR